MSDKPSTPNPLDQAGKVFRTAPESRKPIQLTAEEATEIYEAMWQLELDLHPGG